MIRRLITLALFAAMPGALVSQQRDVVAQAIRAYRDLDFDAATTLLRRALAGPPPLADSTRALALTYLGAAEQYRGHRDSAEAVFRRLILMAPAHSPDTLVFPPEITRFYEDVRSRTQVVTVVVRTDTQAIARADSQHAQPAKPAAADTAPHPTRTPARATSESAPRERITTSADGMVLSVRINNDGGGLPPASGTVLGLAAGAGLGRFELGVRYLEGSLDTRDLVEGAMALRFVATPWLTLHAGPQIRRYEMPSGAERWTTWQLGARAEAPIVGAMVRGHAMLWRGLGLSVSVPPGSGSAAGGEAGVTFDPASVPLSFGLVYSIDQASLQGGRRETLQSVAITMGLRKRS